MTSPIDEPEEKRSRDQQIEGLNRALAFACRCNDSLIHMRDEVTLLRDICALAVEVGGYRMAWVGFAQDDDAKTITPQAHAGAELGYLDEVQVSWSEDIPSGQGTAGMAIRQGKPQIITDLNDDPCFQPWIEAANRRGYRGIVTLPLKDLQGPFGILTLFQEEVDPITDEELKLLQGLADNLAFGIVTLRTRCEQQRVQQAVLSIATAVSARSGDEYFDQLMRHMACAIGADASFVALLDKKTPDVTHTLAVLIDGQVVDSFSYHLPGTPCEQVILEGECIVKDRVAEQLAGVFREPLNWARGYVGKRLANVDGEPTGLLVVMFREPLLEVDFVRSVLQIFAAGAAAELERQSGEAQVRRLAFYDPGTGLPNRTFFMRRLRAAIDDADRDGTKLALMFLGLNHFRDINETQGHDIGDKALVSVAERFATTLRGDGFLARLGGDEFVVMFENAYGARVERTALRLRHSLIQPLAVRGQSFSLGASVGIAFYPEHGRTTRELLKSVDIAMRRAKESGEGHCFFATSLGERVSRRLTLAKRFINALNTGQLQLHYQPQVDLNSGAIIGAEVLCRWHDPEWGWVSPVEFIPVAEERGLMSALGAWVTEEACRQLLLWQRQGHPFSGLLGINVAAQQLEDIRFAERLHTVVSSAGLAPETIVLELTEGGFMADPDQAMWLMRELKRVGFGLAIDDFGTGYSSLAYLKRFSADTLKIDMSFVRDMLTDSHDHTIVTTIIAMAKSLGMNTVAEGVETRAQAEALWALGCSQGQGHYFGRPTDAESFARQWLRASPLAKR
ncbi:bifunctional diguanylate cyclase/phosphodiesterase [Litchfieldella rifensis]|uniref:EAL domain-containing protein n=1 Tax=Litchfieldella rifensis TaxID=762643 RepID=A0ABV7LUY5_9GAMM